MNAQRKEQKRNEAIARNEKWASLTFEQQLESLNTTFGKDKGATKQRAKIAAKILKRDEKPVKAEKVSKPTQKAKTRNKKQRK